MFPHMSHTHLLYISPTSFSRFLRRGSSRRRGRCQSLRLAAAGERRRPRSVSSISGCMRRIRRMRPNDCSTHAYRWIQSCSSHTDRRDGARRTNLLCREVSPFHDVSLVVLKYMYKKSSINIIFISVLSQFSSSS